MLQIIGMSNPLTGTIEIDEYIPLTVEFENEQILDEETLYWRTGDFDSSLIEIGISSKSALVKSIILTLIPSNNIFWNTKIISNINTLDTIGVPVFNIKSWADSGFQDETGTLEVHFADNILSIVLSSVTNIKHKIISNRISFGIDENQFLCTVNLELSDKERDDFHRIFNR